MAGKKRWTGRFSFASKRHGKGGSSFMTGGSTKKEMGKGARRCLLGGTHKKGKSKLTQTLAAKSKKKNCRESRRGMHKSYQKQGLMESQRKPSPHCSA